MRRASGLAMLVLKRRGDLAIDNAVMSVVRRYVRLARTRSREVFIPLSHPPGHVQVDFGECIGVIGGVRMLGYVQTVGELAACNPDAFLSLATVGNVAV